MDQRRDDNGMRKKFQLYFIPTFTLVRSSNLKNAIENASVFSTIVKAFSLWRIVPVIREKSNPLLEGNNTLTAMGKTWKTAYLVVRCYGDTSRYEEIFTRKNHAYRRIILNY